MRDDTNNLITLYVDGSRVSAPKSAIMSAIVLSSGGLWLGQDQDSVGGGFDPNQALEGLLDEVRIWNTLRTGDEIRDNMYLRHPSDEVGLVKQLHFDTGSESFLIDTEPDLWFEGFAD